MSQNPDEKKLVELIDRMRKLGWVTGTGAIAGAGPTLSDRVMAELAYALYQSQEALRKQTECLEKLTIVLGLLTLVTGILQLFF